MSAHACASQASACDAAGLPIRINAGYKGPVELLLRRQLQCSDASHEAHNLAVGPGIGQVSQHISKAIPAASNAQHQRLYTTLSVLQGDGSFWGEVRTGVCLFFCLNLYVGGWL